MNPIRENLVDLAEEVSDVDLYERALRTSRRLGWTRAAVASAAALALVVAIGAAGLTLRGRYGALPPVAPTLPPPGAVPGPNALGRDGAILNGWLDVAATSLPGRAFFVQYDSNHVGDLVDVGSGHVRVGGLIHVNTRCAPNSLTVSPDGRLAAYMRGDSDSVGFAIDLSDLATPERTQVPAAVWCGGQAPIVFAADSKSIIFRRATANGTPGPAVRYRLSDGQVSAVTDREASSVYAGGHSAAIEGGDIVVRDANGLAMSRCATTAPTVVVEVSADGRYVSTAPPAPDGFNQRLARTVIDTLGCQTRNIPAGGEEVVGVRFASNDGLLVLMHARDPVDAIHVRLLKPDGSTAADIPWPPVANAAALAVAPLLYVD